MSTLRIDELSALPVRHWQGALCGSRNAARHAYTVLAFQVAGEVEIEHRGGLTLRPGDLHVIPAGHAHRMIGGTDIEMWGVALTPSRLDPERFKDVLAPLDAISRGAFPRVSITEDRRGFVTALYRELAREEAGSALRRESLLALLLGEIAAHASPTHFVAPTNLRGGDGTRNDVAERAISFIAAHALGPLTLVDVAAELGRNRTHVADMVRRATGQTVGQIIAEIRLDEARRRLEETDEMVEIIGERVGYTDPTHFARSFKRRYGLAPRAFRSRRNWTTQSSLHR